MSRRGIDTLAAIARKEERIILGLMSGTSLDGLDLALCTVNGHGVNSRVELKAFTTAPYEDAFKDHIRAVFAKRTVDLEALTLLNSIIAEKHADLISDALENWRLTAKDVDLIASHGQTVYHAPRSLHGSPDLPNATLQLGDGDHIARRTGIITCSDFRQKHVAAGGEGAPLAAYGDVLLFTDEEHDRVLLNIGGISNLTLVPRKNSAGRAFSTDIGPGNTIMDALAQRDFDRPFDADAEIARGGTVSRVILDSMLQDAFFQLTPPKTTGPEHFSLSWAEQHVTDAGENLSPADLMATLNRLTAETIASAIKALPTDQMEVFVSGGGAHNPLLRRHLSELMPGQQVETTDALGINPDAKEAILFALLANELVAGDAATFDNRLEGAPAITMGKISLPD
ncbi:MAG: anhydro-N-acetylmuramic acid kinase [Pseudomonadota bacterium]